MAADSNDRNGKGVPVPLEGRRVFRFICWASAFYSVFVAAHCVLMTVQVLEDQVAPGTIRSISLVKGGEMLKLDDGRQWEMPWYVLYEQPKRMQLVVSDRVEKRADSWSYVVNGRPITDFAWVLRTMLLPTHLRFFAGAYFILCTSFAVAYRRNPITDSWTNVGTTRGFLSATVRACIGIVLSWLIMVALATVVLGVLGGCFITVLRGIFR